MGYRYYATRELAPRFWFGHGLSYTKFEYNDLTLDKTELTEGETLTASVTVKDVGDRAGTALVQLYVAPPHVQIICPARELKGFEKVELAPGESKAVVFSLEKRAFAHWSEVFHEWRVESGSYQIQICENAGTVLLEQAVTVKGAKPCIKASLGTPMSEFAASAEGYAWLDENIEYLVRGMAQAGFMPTEAVSALEQLGGGRISLEALDLLTKQMGGDGTNALLGQAMSLLNQFLPEEKKHELTTFLDKMNA